MAWIKIASKLLLGPIGKMIGGWLTLGGAFVIGARYKKAQDDKKRLKTIRRQLKANQNVKKQINALDSSAVSSN